MKKPKPVHLVVDDSKVNRMILKISLENMDIDVLQAENGKEALDILDNYPEIEMVWLDIQMPVMNGLTCAVKMKERDIKCPVIAVTGHSKDGIVKKCKDIGFKSVVYKPVDNKTIAHCIHLN